MSLDRSLWRWQETEYEHRLDEARAFHWDPRTGKTYEAVLHIESLVRERGIRRILIVAPKMVCSEVWLPELERVQIPSVHVHLLSSGTLAFRANIIEEIRKASAAHQTRILIINWDVIAKKGVLDALLKWRPELVIADELHYAKSAGAARSRALQRLGRVARYRRGLTGTPTPKNYIDAYAQYKFLDPTIFGTSQAKFIEKYVELDYWGRPKRYRKLTELRQKMFSIASRVDRRAVWHDKPPQEIFRGVILPDKARKLYDRLAEESIAEFQGIEIDATHKLTQIVRLQQLTAGFVQDGDEVKWVHTEKIDTCIEELRDLLASGQKVVVFFHFTPEGIAYEAAIRKEFGAVVGRIDGSTPDRLRKQLAKSFDTPESDVRVLLMQDSLGIGISLKAASYCIRTSYPLDYAAFVQSNDRIYEPHKALTYIYLDAPRTVDKFGRDVVLRKQTASRRLLDVGFASAVRGE